MKKNRVVLAYSGGLDTSIILKWLQTKYNFEVIVFTADLGQGDDLDMAKKKAISLGIKNENIFVEDLKEEFVENFVFPMFRANAVYEGYYLLGTSIARPLISKRLVEIAKETNSIAISHGATGKGNDQIRFELSAYALNPNIKIIAPWREWDLNSRSKLIEFAEKHQIPITKDKKGEAPFSIDSNILHTSSEGKILEDPSKKAPEYIYQIISNPKEAPDESETIEIFFHKGDPKAINGNELTCSKILHELNLYGARNGIGRIDIVENRYLGMKSRGVYETPGGTILLKARKALESITLDSGSMHLKDELMPKYAKLIYDGYWFSPEREMLQVLIDKSQEYVTGFVKLEFYKGNVFIVSRKSEYSLYSEKHVTFEDDNGLYDQKDAEGFINLNALRLKFLGKRNVMKIKK